MCEVGSPSCRVSVTDQSRERACASTLLKTVRIHNFVVLVPYTHEDSHDTVPEDKAGKNRRHQNFAGRRPSPGYTSQFRRACEEFP